MRWQPWAIGAGVIAGSLFVLDRVFAAVPCIYIPASIHGGKRSLSSLRWIVIHTTDADTSALSTGNYFAEAPHPVELPSGKTVTQPGGSTQVVVGEDGCVRSVPDDVIPAGARPLNDTGLHIEFVGLASWSRDKWLKERRKTLEIGRRIIRDWSRQYGVPRLFHNADMLKTAVHNDGRGVTTHAAATLAFHESDHMDPGPGFPLDFVLGGF